MRPIKSIFLLLVSLAILSSPYANVGAISGSEWRAGRIIDDEVFTNAYEMSVQDIQNFLNARVPSCDTWGTQPSEYGGGTRAQYAASRGYSAPFTCLKDYYEVPKTTPSPAEPASNYGGVAIPQGAQSAAQIIANAAIKYSINPKVLLVKLATESPGPLTSDDWPFKKQYLYAMGAHCPDSGPGGSANCDSNWSGFSLQMDEAASLMRWYLDSMTQSWWQYKKPYQVNNILWNVSPSGCGSSDVYIETKATAALYTYTPYQPNQSALNNLYGSGDRCSAYGNRNFWRVYSDWFLSTYISSTFIKNGIPITIVTQPPSSASIGQTINYTISLKNTLSSQITLNSVGIVGRAGSSTNGSNRDFGWTDPVTLAPNESRSFTFTTTIKDLGNIYVWPAILYKGGFIQYNNWGSTVNGRTPNFTLSQPLVTDTPPTYARQKLTFTATLKNNESVPISYDAVGIPVRLNNANYDSTWVGPGIIQPGAEIALNGTQTVNASGQLSYWVSSNIGGNYVTIDQVKKTNLIEATPNFSVSGLSFNPALAVKDQSLAASFTVKNNLPVAIDVDSVGVVGRYGSFTGQNRDLGWTGSVHFEPSETKSFSGISRSITDIGTHYYWIGIFNKGSYIQYNNWGSTIVSQQ
ncbi:MAG: hypothetical protein WBB33_00590 [Candidatus Saccharimonadales bacterium]